MSTETLLDGSCFETWWPTTQNERMNGKPKIVPYVTAVASECRRHLANVIAIAKAFANWTETLPSSKSCDKETRTDIKNLLRTKVRYCSVVSESVFICQLTLKMAEEIDFENWRISNFDLDLGSGHTAYRRASLIDLYLHTKFHQNRKNLFVDGWTDIRTDWRMDGHLTHVISEQLKKGRNGDTVEWCQKLALQ